MKTILLTSLVTFVVLKFTEGYDIFEGLAALSTPCFEVFHDEGCNTSLPEVFDPPYKGMNINPPNTQFYLFTQKNKNKAEPLHRCGGKLPPKSNFDPNVDTVLIVHGFLDGVCRTAWMREMRNQFFIRGQCNVILVDWTWGNTPEFSGAGYNSVVVGEQIAFVLKNIMSEKKMNGNRFHLVGHSFGSIAVGYAGKNVIRWKKSKKLRRITHLDSAVVPFRNEPKERNLSPNDAKFVDVIHSNEGNCFPINIGNDQTLGHIDFYPNGGRVQTSCIKYAFESLLKADVLYGSISILLPQFCFHLQAIQFFKVSINPPAGLYIGVRCNNYEEFQSGACKRCCREDFTNCAVAGMDSEYYYTPSKTRGNQSKYFFNTYDHCPFPEDYDFSIHKDCKDSLQRRWK